MREFNEGVVDMVLQGIEINICNKDKLFEEKKNDKRGSRKYKHVSARGFPKSNNFNEVLPIGKYVRKTFMDLVREGKLDSEEIERLQRPEYSKDVFDIQFPFLAKENSQYYERTRYWTKPYKINGELYFVCSQWYEVPANNDRPYYEDWLRRIKKEQ